MAQPVSVYVYFISNIFNFNISNRSKNLSLLLWTVNVVFGPMGITLKNSYIYTYAITYLNK